jgi:serine/threonine-protein kinase
VFRALDTRLGRDVAIKVLPEAFAADADRLARFQREAKLLASLNHAHIAIVHGLERGGDIYALVMELVGGEDLSERIARGAIPIDEALPIARQIAVAETEVTVRVVASQDPSANQGRYFAQTRAIDF